MSAFIVDDWHINTLANYGNAKRLQVYWKGDCQTHAFTDPQAIAEVLLRENYRSVNYRYEKSDKPHAINFRLFHYTTDPVQIIKATYCFDYQACESPDYEDSLAFTLIRAIREHAIQAIPGYDDAPGWDLNEPAGGPGGEMFSIFNLS